MARDSMRVQRDPGPLVPGAQEDRRHPPTLPDGVVGPFFNDEFGDTFGNIYALTGEGFDYAVLKDYAERVELELQRVPDVGKVELIGLQDEKIWIELSNTKLATLGIPLSAVQQALRAAERGDRRRASSRPAAIACSCASTGALQFGGRDPRIPDPRRRPHRSASATSPTCIAASPIRPRRACASWARTIGIAVAIMYLGNIVEFAEGDELFERPLHPSRKRSCRRRCRRIRMKWSRRSCSRVRCRRR